MRKGTRLTKRLAALFLVLLLSIESFGAVVSDNDGSAFITKAEFDSLKNNFQSQIDQYNTSIDSKIDGAIASYLAGLKVAKQVEKNFFNGAGNVALIVNTEKVNDLKKGKTKLTWITYWGGIGNGLSFSATNIIFKMSRSSIDEYYEGFLVDRTTRKMVCWSKNIITNIQATMTRAEDWNFGSYSYTGNSVTPLWHAYWEGQCTPHDWEYVSGNGYTYYVKDLRSSAFYKWYDSVLNSGWRDDNLDRRLDTYSCSIEFNDKDNDYAELLFDGTICDGTTSSIKPEVFVSYKEGDISMMESANNYKSESWDNSTLPPGDITVAVDGVYAGKQSENANRGKLSNFGGWLQQATVTTGGSISTRTSNTWYEPVMKTEKMDPTKIINACVTNTLLEQYSGYGWNGNITQGVPIDTYKDECELEFEIDCSTLTKNCIVAFSTSPFDAKLDIKSQVNSPEITYIEIDSNGKDMVNDWATLTYGSRHRIKIGVTPDESTIPVFMKIGWEPGTTNSIRELIKLPKTYMCTTF